MAEWERDEDADTHSISLTVEINVELALLEDCVALTAASLREVADRIEEGEESGKILDDDGNEIGWYDTQPEDAD
jgi:hypothetical protein